MWGRLGLYLSRCSALTDAVAGKNSWVSSWSISSSIWKDVTPSTESDPELWLCPQLTVGMAARSTGHAVLPPTSAGEKMV